MDKISWSSIPGRINTWHGYGRASANIIKQWKSLGVQVPFKDESAKVQIHFSQPWYYDFYPDQYKIGYTPWESTELPPGWRETMNDCDAVFTTSEVIKSIYETNGVTKPIYVFTHGVEECWYRSGEPQGRPGPIKFLQDGAEPRKNARLAVAVFRKAFGNSKDVSLTIKTRANLGMPDYDNVHYITETLTDEQMVDLYHSHDVFMNLSAFEGFGFPGAQAVASGMAVLTTAGWAPYSEFTYNIDSKLIDSPWPKIHPGKVFKPDFDCAVDHARFAADNIDWLKTALSVVSVNDFRRKFDWKILSNNALEHIENVIGLTN